MADAHQHLKLGIIGLSEGNGHPFSWAAICNGYDPVAMAGCGFPVIPEYLSRQKYPADFLTDVTVTHVWTQDEAITRKVAAASRITHVCHKPEDMLGEVDGLLLARDDAGNHHRFASPFLRAGIPVYVDKPLALSRAAADRLLNEAREPWQLFSCSALYFAEELLLDAGQRTRIGELRAVHAVTPMKWETYAAHLVDPVLRYIAEPAVIVEHRVWREREAVHLFARWRNGPVTCFHATGRANCEIRIHYIGEQGEQLTIFQDSFRAFRSALAAFLEQVRTRRLMIPREHLLRVVAVLEAGSACVKMDQP